MVGWIMCQTCQTVMGTIQKDSFQYSDADTYLASIKCPNGHTNAGVYMPSGAKVSTSPVPGQPTPPVTGSSSNVIADLLKLLLGGH